jgi:hypothetical protein
MTARAYVGVERPLRPLRRFPIRCFIDTQLRKAPRFCKELYRGIGITGSGFESRFFGGSESPWIGEVPKKAFKIKALMKSEAYP